MTVVEFAQNMIDNHDTPERWLKAIETLQKGNPKWGPFHKLQVNELIQWMISGSRNIYELKAKFKNQNMISIPW